jgi:pimeloyl-ACP methyl ester carboxylesterase
VSNSDKSQPEFHADPNTPYWRAGAMLIDDNLDFIDSDYFDITSNLNSFSGRLLFIGSEKVLNELPEYASRQMKYYPKKELITIPGVGHTGPWEDADAVAEAIRNFLKNN